MELKQQGTKMLMIKFTLAGDNAGKRLLWLTRLYYHSEIRLDVILEMEKPKK